MPINALPKNSPRGRGPEPSQPIPQDTAEKPEGEERIADLAAQEIQDLWESQEIGITRWSGEGGNRYSDPD
jgi:hypothetical protein